MKKSVHSHLFVLIAVFQIVFGLREDLVKEKPCIPGPLNVVVDSAWFGAVDRFYAPLWSKLHMYRRASDAYEQDASLISEYKLPSACIEFKKQNGVLAFGRELKYDIRMDKNSFYFKAPWHGAKSGNFEFHLSDNRSFILAITCWEDDQSSWAVLSTTKTLTPEIRRVVLEYLKSLGFREDLIKDETYDRCAGINSEL